MGFGVVDLVSVVAKHELQLSEDAEWKDGWLAVVSCPRAGRLQELSCTLVLAAVTVRWYEIGLLLPHLGLLWL